MMQLFSMFSLWWLLGLVVAFYLYRAIQLIPQQQVALIERLGRFHAKLDPGVHILVPFIDRVAARHDLREVPSNVPAQACITKDNVTISVDGVIYFQVTDPYKATYGSVDPYLAAINLAQATMRAVVGDMTLDDTLSSRESLNARIVAVLDQASETWGLKVLRYAVRDIVPPSGILEAMEMQLRAERERRAVVLASEATRTQDINVSQGQRERDVNLAEGAKTAAILRAEGEAEAIRVVSAATASAIETVSQAIAKSGGSEAVQYLLGKDFVQQWGAIAKASTTVVVPADMGSVAGLVNTALASIKR